MIARKLSVMLAAALFATSVSGFNTACAATVVPTLSTDEAADLTFMREEEKLARDTYLVFNDTWKMTVFANIASSEQSHMDAILKLLNKYKLPDPAASTLIGQFTNPELQELFDALIAKGLRSDLDALLVGGIIEETDMDDIQAAIEHSQKADIDAVYESLLCGSRNHLRAFAANILAKSGTPYTAQVLEQQEVDEILASPMEQCGN